MLTQSQSTLLPELRQDLQLMQGAPSIEGQPRWMVYDPLRHRYFEIPQSTFEILSAWTPGDPGLLRLRTEQLHQRSISDQEIDDVIYFATTNSLCADPPEGDSRQYLDRIEKPQRGWLSHAIHNYLFFRVPLLRPQRFLQQSFPIVAPLYSKAAFLVIVFTSLLGIYLVSREWDEFAGTFLHFFSPEGFILYGLSLVFIKTLHELGHAYTAVRYGVRVNAMGVAFMMMLPLLYTDVTDAWRLQSRKERFAIGAAGIAVELAVAGICTFLWVFLPDGPLRSIVFLLATTSWLMSLAVNLNPFMRFDGYYLLSDSWGIPNLQPRSFALGRWWLRELLFGLGQPRPDTFNSTSSRYMIAYCFGVWIYRFFLFLGIALLVYQTLFKTLGILLFAVEIFWFILLPFLRELGEWWHMRKEIMQTRRSVISGLICAGVIAASTVPWSTTVVIPAVANSMHEAKIFAPMPAQIASVWAQEGLPVNKGDTLFVLVSADLEHQIENARATVALLKARLARRAGDTRELTDSLVHQQSLSAAQEKLAGLLREQDRLTVRAPIAGVIRDLNADAHNGQWVSPKDRLGLVVDPFSAMVTAVTNEDDLWRLAQGAPGQFVPEDPSISKFSVEIRDIAQAGAEKLEIPYLASIYGGAIAAERDEDSNVRPVNAAYIVRFGVNGTGTLNTMRGVVRVAGRAESIASALWRQTMRVLVREAGI